MVSARAVWAERAAVDRNKRNPKRVVFIVRVQFAAKVRGDFGDQIKKGPVSSDGTF